MKNLWALIGILCGFLVHKPLGVACDGLEDCDPNVVEDLHKRIETAFSEYPEKPMTALLLSVIYNADQTSLTRFTERSAPKVYECENAEKRLKDFIELASDYDSVVPKMEEAIQDLKEIDGNDGQLRYDALKVKTTITFSTSIREAEEALKDYEAFKAAE